MITDINSEELLIQQAFVEHQEQVLRWESVYGYNTETFRRNGALGRAQVCAAATDERTDCGISQRVFYFAPMVLQTIQKKYDTPMKTKLGLQETQMLAYLQMRKQCMVRMGKLSPWPLWRP